MVAPLWHFQFGGISELIRILIGFINQLIYILDRSIQKNLDDTFSTAKLSVRFCVCLHALWNVYPVKSLLHLFLWGEAYSSGVANSPRLVRGKGMTYEILVDDSGDDPSGGLHSPAKKD